MLLTEWADTKRSMLSKLVGFLSSKAFSERFAEVATQLKGALGVLADVAALRTAVLMAQMYWPEEKAQRAALAADLQRLVAEVRSSNDAVKREVQVGAGWQARDDWTQLHQPFATLATSCVIS